MTTQQDDDKLVGPFNSIEELLSELKEPQEAKPVEQSQDAVLMPLEPTHEILSAMACSIARDDEGEFPSMSDLLDYSGENKTHTVLRAAYKAAIAQKADKQ